jgi:hypothetical protein
MRSTEHDGKFPIGLAVTFMQYLRMLGNARLRQVIPSGLQNWRTSRCTRAAAARLLAIVNRLPPPGDPGRARQTPDEGRNMRNANFLAVSALIAVSVFGFQSVRADDLDVEFAYTSKRIEGQAGIYLHTRCQWAR